MEDPCRSRFWARPVARGQEPMQEQGMEPDTAVSIVCTPGDPVISRWHGDSSQELVQTQTQSQAGHLAIRRPSPSGSLLHSSPGARAWLNGRALVQVPAKPLDTQWGRGWKAPLQVTCSNPHAQAGPPAAMWTLGTTEKSLAPSPLHLLFTY